MSGTDGPDDRSEESDGADRRDGTGGLDGISAGIELTPEHPLDRVTELAERAETAGFGTALVSCHYFNRDPFVAADRIAGATDLRVGPAAANPYDTHPAALASRVATLQEASDGRAVMGLAPGDRSTLRNLGIDRDRPLRRTLETMRTARRLWAGDRIDADGAVELQDAELKYSVDPVPVYVGAQGPDMIRMSGKHADGILLNASHPRDVAWAADRVREGERERPPDRPGVDFVAYASVSIAAEEAPAREAARAPVSFIVGGAADPVLERHGIDRAAAEEVARLVEAGDLREAFAAVTPSMIDAFAVAGDPDSVETRLSELLEYVDGVVVGAPLGPDLETAITLAGRVIRRTAREH